MARDEEDEGPGPGHNSAPVAVRELRAFVERIEALEDRKALIAEDIKGVYVEVKSGGFDVKTLRKVIALRKIDDEKRVEQANLLQLYADALGLDLV
jgi:uncharacterized protein (UPF0335 family)